MLLKKLGELTYLISQINFTIEILLDCTEAEQKCTEERPLLNALSVFDTRYSHKQKHENNRQNNHGYSNDIRF